MKVTALLDLFHAAFCPTGWQHDIDGERCYLASESAEDWATAANICLNVSNNAGKLAEPRDNESAQSVRNRYVSGTNND